MTQILLPLGLRRLDSALGAMLLCTAVLACGRGDGCGARNQGREEPGHPLAQQALVKGAWQLSWAQKAAAAGALLDLMSSP